MVKTSYGPTPLSLISLIVIKYCEASTNDLLEELDMHKTQMGIKLPILSMK
jgi:hypothetical protein